MTSPYKDATIEARVVLYSDKLNENLYKNLLKRLKHLMVGKCNQDGFITKIYTIESYDEGLIMAEDLSCKPLFEVKFGCQICRPIQHTNITAKIQGINNAVIMAVNGPIQIVIAPNLGRYDSNNFTLNSKSLLVKNNDKTYLDKNDIVNIKVMACRFAQGDRNIIVVGFLNRLATKKEIKNFLVDQESVSKSKYVDSAKVNKRIYADSVGNSESYMPDFTKDMSGSEDSGNENAESDTEKDNEKDTSRIKLKKIKNEVQSEQEVDKSEEPTLHKAKKPAKEKDSKKKSKKSK